MDSSQRQALILSRINFLRKYYDKVQARIAIIKKRRIKINAKKELMKTAIIKNKEEVSLLITDK